MIKSKTKFLTIKAAQQLNKSRALLNNSRYYLSSLFFKILMFSFASLPPSNLPMNTNEFLAARDIVECEMDFNLSQNNEKGFEKAYLKCKSFYYDYSKQLGKSDKMLYFAGLYLLHLLANNRNTEYSTELELLTIEDHQNECIKVPIRLEQSILEGSYKQIKGFDQLDPNYKYYLNKFDGAIRFQIASSAERSYESLKLTDAVSLLRFNNTDQLFHYIKSEIEINEVNRLIKLLKGKRNRMESK